MNEAQLKHQTPLARTKTAPLHTMPHLTAGIAHPGPVVDAAEAVPVPLRRAAHLAGHHRAAERGPAALGAQAGVWQL